MKTIKERLAKKLGYMPSDYEIVSMYQSGRLTLTDSEENEIINYIYNTLWKIYSAPQQAEQK